VPRHLRDTSHPQAIRRLGHGEGYQYPHDHPGGFVRQAYRPPDLQERRYYYPTGHGAEATIRRRLEEWWGAPESGGDERPDSGGEGAR